MREGDLLDKRFRIERRAGEGAMGTVFRARDLRSGEWVAVKAFRSDAQASAPAPRFEREAEALASLRAEGVVRYVHHGLDRQGRPFLVMEWLDGPALDQPLRGGALQAWQAVQLAQRLARALAAVHRAGIVHRDLKPSNIVLPGGELARATIVDFGIARLAAASTAITTQRGQLGTPRYMAPEQIRDAHDVDGRADVFALGCVLFECLTGAPAFGGDDPVVVLAHILFQAALEPSVLVPALPEAIDRLLERLLARERAQRPEAEALALELAQLAGSPLATELAALPANRAAGTAVSAVPGDGRQRDARSERTVADEPPLRLSVELDVSALQPNLPGAEPAGALIGRERELEALLPELERGAPLALWGGAGIGKTRLALELARRSALGAGAGAVLLVDLGAARSTEEAVREVAERTGLTLPPTERPEPVVGALLAKLGRMLLVLDRVERLAGQIEPLIRLWSDAAPELRLVATSRVRLRLPLAFELGPLATADATATAGAGARELSPAAGLLFERARALLPELPSSEQLEPGTAAALERVARALDGIPLALELAAARVSILGFDGMLARLSAPLELLTDPRGSAHADPMRAALELSWTLLGEHERQVFMQCALFRGGFELAAAEAVVALAPGAPPLPALLQALREQSLLVARPERHDPLRVRLSMLAAVRELAHEQWTQHAARQPMLGAAPMRHARHYAELARSVLSKSGASRASLSSPFHHERDNAIAAVEHLLDPAPPQPPDPRAALWLLRALEPELLARGPSGELARLLERALALAQAPGSTLVPAFEADVAAARQVRARLLAPAGRLREAQQELTAVLRSAERLGLLALQATAWLDLGVVHHFARELEQAGQCYQRALQQLGACDDVVSEARAAGNLAAIAHDRAQLQEALRGYRQAIALLEATPEARLLANFWGNRALCEHELEQLDAARGAYLQAIALLEPLGDARLLGIVLSNFATLELEQERLAPALALHDRACALLDGAGDPRSHALARGRRAAALALQGHPQDAERDCAGAERSLRRDPIGKAVVELLRGFVDLAHARRAAGAAQARSELDSAERRWQSAHDLQLHDRSLLDQCDDARLFSRILARELERARAGDP